MSEPTFEIVSAEDAVQVKFNNSDSPARRSTRLEELLHARQLTGRDVVALEEQIHRRAAAEAARFPYRLSAEALAR
jgi:hypothetical protein